MRGQSSSGAEAGGQDRRRSLVSLILTGYGQLRLLLVECRLHGTKVHFHFLGGRHAFGAGEHVLLNPPDLPWRHQAAQVGFEYRLVGVSPSYPHSSTPNVVGRIPDRPRTGGGLLCINNTRRVTRTPDR